MRNIHNHVWASKAHVQHGHQTLSACQDLCAISLLVQEFDDLRNCSRSAIFERCRFHDSVLAVTSAIACQTRVGVMGVKLIGTRRGMSASTMALAMAAGGAIAPPSPIPFIPNSVKGDSVS